MKRRILQICSADYFGGGERHVVDLSDSLAARGHDVYLAMRRSSPLAEKLARVPAENVRSFSMRNAADVVSAASIAHFAKRVGAELIHAHLARDYPIAAAASRLSGIPYFVTRHVLFPLGRAHRKLLSGVSAVVAPSKAVYDSLLVSGLFMKEKVHLIRYAVDRRRFGSVRKTPHETFTIGSAARLTHNKGHDVAARAAKMVLDQKPDVRFVIAGEDPPDPKERRDIEAVIGEMGLDRRFELVGKVDDIPHFLSGLDLFVSASRVESFGLSLVEAMMAGVPVVASRTEGSVEIIEDRQTGMLTPVEDHVALSDAIIELIDNPDLRERLAANARARSIDEFSLEKMVDDTERLYEDVLLGRNG